MLVAALAFLLGGLTVVTLYHFDVLGGTSDSAGSATEGSGVAATQAREVAAFQSIDLAGSNNVVIRVGEKQSVVVKADDNLLDRVTTEVQLGHAGHREHSGQLHDEEPDGRGDRPSRRSTR